MVTNHSFEEQLRKLISEAQDKLHDIELQIENLNKDKNVSLEGLQAYEITLRNYLREIGQEPEQELVNWDNILSQCKTHRDRLIVIAEHYNGILKQNQATDILYNGKFINSHSRSNAYLIIYGTLNSMVDKKEFEKVDRGTYRLTMHMRSANN
jgi:hypothetical protein